MKKFRRPLWKQNLHRLSLVQHMFLYVIKELLTNSLQIAFLIVLLELFNEYCKLSWFALRFLNSWF